MTYHPTGEDYTEEDHMVFSPDGDDHLTSSPDGEPMYPKRCSRCGVLNHPDNVNCGKCGALLKGGHNVIL